MNKSFFRAAAGPRGKAADATGAAACRLPPDVEPPEERGLQAMQRWIAASGMAASDRGAACKGAALGECVGELLLRLARMLPGCAKPALHVPVARPARAGRAGSARPLLYPSARALHFGRAGVRHRG